MSGNRATLYNPHSPLLLNAFLQALMDGNERSVEKILNDNPDLVAYLLLATPPTDMVIVSKLTHHQVYAENALKMLAIRKQIKMMKILLPYYVSLPVTERASEVVKQAFAAWKNYGMKVIPNDKDEIILPEEYLSYAQSLLKTFREETFPNGYVTDVPENAICQKYALLTEKTELKLFELLNNIVPAKAVKLDELIDVELLLLAVCKLFNRALNIERDKRLDVFCIRVMGCIQGALVSETGQLWCHGLHAVKEMIRKGEEIKIDREASSHKLRTGQPFYRDSREACSGNGFEFTCREDGWQQGIRWGSASSHAFFYKYYFERIMCDKQNKAQEIFKLLFRWAVDERPDLTCETRVKYPPAV